MQFIAPGTVRSSPQMTFCSCAVSSSLRGREALGQSKIHVQVYTGIRLRKSCQERGWLR